ncbi:MAG: hypothetical protein IKO36_03365 [Bacteroidaceae bacterium]|nr:hypothetical protein [Bacteroidaceae bacterium]
MLYTKKDIEKVYSNLVAEYIAKGARIDFGQNNYSCSEFDCHVDLLAEDGARIIIYITTGAACREAFRRYDRGLCEINVRVCKPVKNDRGGVYYPRSDEEEFTAFKFFRYKNVYTNDEETYRIMNAVESERRHVCWEYEKNVYKVNYDPSLVLSIIRKRKGYKRTKAENILMVEKRDGRFSIYVNTRGKNEIIVVG